MGVNMKNTKKVILPKKIVLQILTIALALSIAGVTDAVQAADNQITSNRATTKTEAKAVGPTFWLRKRRIETMETVSTIANKLYQSTENGWKYCQKHGKKLSIATLTLTAGLMLYVYGRSGSKLLILLREIGNCNIYKAGGAVVSGYLGCKLIGSCVRDYVQENRIKSAVVVTGAAGAIGVLDISDTLCKIIFDMLAALIKRVNPELLIALGSFDGAKISDVTLPLWIGYSGWKALKHVLNNDVSATLVVNENEGGVLQVRMKENDSEKYAAIWSLVALISAIRAVSV